MGMISKTILFSIIITGVILLSRNKAEIKPPPIIPDESPKQNLEQEKPLDDDKIIRIDPESLK